MHFVWSNKQETNAHCFVYKGQCEVEPWEKTGMCWEAKERMREDVLLNKRPWDCCCVDSVTPQDPFYLCITQTNTWYCDYSL